MKALTRAGGGMELRDELRAALTDARELVRTRQLRTRGEWRDRGHLVPGTEFLEEADAEALSAAEAALLA